MIILGGILDLGEQKYFSSEKGQVFNHYLCCPNLQE